jgi:hypothetical protein
LGFFSKLFKWIGKALKILSIVALVVMTIIIFAPASSFIFKAALWIFFHVLLPLSQIPVLGAFVPIGMMGSPQWNPNSRAILGNSWQGQGQGTEVGSDGVVRTTIWAPGPWWDEFLRAVPSSGIGTPWLFGEWMTGGGPRSRRFDASSKITSNLRTSPDVETHRRAFCASGKDYYNSSDHPALRFGLNATDGPVNAGPVNEGRQFVGSFELRIKNTRGGDVLFVVKNKTSLPSALYHIPGVPNVTRPGPLQTITQYYWWTEGKPCK